MGCDAAVVVVGDARLGDVGRRRIDELEARWSRFRDDSELTRLARHHGVPVVVSPDTFLLVERAVAAWHATDGRFDPTVLDALVACGYDRTFEDVGATTRRHPARPAPGCASIRLDPVVRAVTVPPGVRLDPGGIGKGLAADLAVDALLAAGARGALVEIGGDVRVSGEPPDGAAWQVAVEEPAHVDHELARVELRDGGVATSGTTWRRWTCDGEQVHHLVDPRTGAPSTSDLVSATVVADTASSAEVLATAAFLAGARGARGVLRRAGASGVLVDRHGALHLVGDPAGAAA
jgi:thiamine biosynthesis lipoprotein